jgi:hypothetical protein
MSELVHGTERQTFSLFRAWNSLNCRDLWLVLTTNTPIDKTPPHVWTADFHNMLFSRTTNYRDDTLYLSTSGGTLTLKLDIAFLYYIFCITFYYDIDDTSWGFLKLIDVVYSGLSVSTSTTTTLPCPWTGEDRRIGYNQEIL